MVRGIERRAIFRDDVDRADFVARLATLVKDTGLTVYALWAVLPIHPYPPVRTGSRSLPRSLRSLHLNPLRAKIVPDLRALDRYPYTGHAVLLGRRQCPWQDTASVLGRFATRPSRARRAYREFVLAGMPQGRRPDLQGGGLVRSLGGWAVVQALRRGREQYAADERILGSSAFVATLHEEIEAPPAKRRRPVPLDAIVERVCAAVHIAPPVLQAGSRRAAVCRAREGIAYLGLEVEGYPAPRLVALLGVRPPFIHKAAQRGRAGRERWDHVLRAEKK